MKLSDRRNRVLCAVIAVVVVCISTPLFATFTVVDVHGRLSRISTVTVENDQLITTEQNTKKKLPLASLMWIETPAPTFLFKKDLNTTVELLNGDIIHAFFDGIEDNTKVKLQSPFFSSPVNIKYIKSLTFPVSAETKASLPQTRTKSFSQLEDFIVFTDGDVEAGIIKAFSSDTILVESSIYKKDLEYKMGSVYKIMFALLDSPPDNSDNPVTVVIKNKMLNSFISGELIAVDGSTVKLKSPFFPEVLDIPLNAVSDVAFIHSNCLFLSDIEPIEVEEHSGLIGGNYPYRRDSNVIGSGNSGTVYYRKRQ